MRANVGDIERVIRFAAGCALLAYFFLAAGALAWVAGIVGIVLAVTALAGWCPAYRLLGLSTCAR
jgi:hypothetical protein